jgi:hypothetical protein
MLQTQWNKHLTEASNRSVQKEMHNAMIAEIAHSILYFVDNKRVGYGGGGGSRT